MMQTLCIDEVFTISDEMRKDMMRMKPNKSNIDVIRCVTYNARSSGVGLLLESICSWQLHWAFDNLVFNFIHVKCIVNIFKYFTSEVQRLISKNGKALLTC